MKKLFKVILISIILLAILISATIFYIVKFIDPNDFKDQIIQIVAEKTHRTLTINGDIGWGFFPHLELKTKNITLSSPQNFTADDFAKLDKLEIRVKLFPLLHKEIQADKIILQNLVLHLIKNQSGLTNWQDLLDKQNNEPAEAAAVIAINVANIEINNAAIIFENQQAAKTLKINGLSLDGENINIAGTPFPLKINCQIENTDPILKGDFAFSGIFSLDFNKQIYTLKNLKITGNLLTPNLKNKPLPFAANANIQLNLNTQTLDIPNLQISADKAEAQSKIQVSNIINAPQMTGTIKTNTFNPKPLLAAFGIEENLPKTAFNNASADLSIQTTAKFLKIPRLILNIDTTKITGACSYSHFTDKYLVLNFSINNLDLDKYLSTTAKSIPNTPQNVKSLSKKTMPLTFQSERYITHKQSIWQNLMLDGDLHINQLKTHDLKFNNLNITMHGTPGIIDIDPINCRFYGGMAHGKIHLDLQNIPLFASELYLESISVNSLLKDLANTDKISGTAKLNLKITSQGKDTNAILKNLNGNGSLKLNNGVFHGINIQRQIAQAKTLLSQKNPLKTLPNIIPDSSAQTNFGTLSADFTITDGLLNTKTLSLLSNDFKVLGQGTANFVTQILNFQLKAYGIITTNKITDFYVPIKINNTFNSPSFSIDLTALSNQIAKKVVSQKVSEQLQKQGIDKKITKKIIDLFR